MYPWLWFWAPQFHFPFSGSVATAELARVLGRFSQATPLLGHQRTPDA